MSTRVKERLKQLALEMTHEERVYLDEALDKLAMSQGVILVKGEKPCDKIIEEIPDDKLTEIVRRIKLKKKKKVLVEA